MASKRRYLVITELFLPTKGGTAVWFDEVYRRIGDKSTHIVTAEVPDAGLHDSSHPNTVHRIQLQRSTWIRPSSLPVYLKFFLVSFILAVWHKIDVIHAGRVLPEGLVGLLVARLTRLPIVIYAHGEEITTWRRSPRRLKAMTYAYRHADKIVANSRYTQQQLILLGVNPEQISLINPGVDLNHFNPQCDTAGLRQSIGLSNDDKLILSVGRLSRRKGFDQIVKVIARLKQKKMNVHYALIGIGEDRSYLETLSREEGVFDQVHFLGHVSPDELPRWYNTVDVFAMPNREIDGDTEGFGMVFLEAAACGKPAIAGNAGGTGDAVVNEVTGYRVDGTSLDELENAFTIILKNSNTANTMGENGHQRAVSEFSWDKVAEKTVLL